MLLRHLGGVYENCVHSPFISMKWLFIMKKVGKEMKKEKRKKKNKNKNLKAPMEATSSLHTGL